jgi:hypothetical protein
VGIIVKCVPYVGCQQDLKSQHSNYACFELTFRKSVSSYANAYKIIAPEINVMYLGKEEIFCS